MAISNYLRSKAYLAALEFVSRTELDSSVLKTIPRAFRDEARAQAAETSKWSQSPTIVGFGLGRKKTAGKRLGERCIRVYVEKKVPRQRLSAPVPQELPVFDSSLEIPTDVIEIGRVRPQAFTGLRRPPFSGCSIGHPLGAPGTIGGLVRRNGRAFILTCSHVAALSGNAQIGDPILQPPGEDSLDNRIGTLADFVEFDRSDSPFDQVDAALVQPSEEVSDYWYDGSQITGMKWAVEGGQVQLVGAVSGFQSGRIEDTFFRKVIYYRRVGYVWFQQQILTTKMSAAGDSGALLISADHRAVGLLIGGSEASSVFNPIQDVARLLQFTL